MATRKFMPHNLIGGVLPVAGKADPMEVAFHAAANALETEAVKLIYSVNFDKVYYLAAPADEFASVHDETACSLAIALPGMPGHLGKGVYFDSKSVVSFTGDAIKVYVGPDFQRFIDKEKMGGLSEYPSGGISLLTLPAWSGINERKLTAHRKLFRLSMITGIITAATMSALWLGASAWSGVSHSKIEDVAAKAHEDVLAAVNVLNQPQHASTAAFAEINRVGQFVMEKGGVSVVSVKQFEYANGKAKWVIIVPTFITGEDISRSLGAGLKQTPSSDGRIEVSKGI